MAFSDEEAAEHLQVLETAFWEHRRPPLHLRDQVREGQRIEDQSIELFLDRQSFMNPEERIEEAIAKLTWVRSKKHWKLFWMRADHKWHAYPEHPTAKTLEEGLQVIHKDAFCCFFG